MTTTVDGGVAAGVVGAGAALPLVDAEAMAAMKPKVAEVLAPATRTRLAKAA